MHTANIYPDSYIDTYIIHEIIQIQECTDILQFRKTG